jgi:hypothetical protein
MLVHTAYESPETNTRYNLHGLKQQKYLAEQILHVHVSLICFYFYLNAILPLSDCHDITEILLKVALNAINQPSSF